MKANLPLTTFNGGIASPQLAERIDLEKYPSLCRILQNFIPTIYGGVKRRPGTIYVATATADTVRLLPFIYSSEIAYLIESSDLKMRFFYDDQHLSAADIVTDYDADDIFNLHFKQVADVMRLVTLSKSPKTLSRTDAEVFQTEEIDFKGGPFLTRNDLIDPTNTNPSTLQCTATAVGTYGSLKSSAPVFENEHIGALFKLTHKRTLTQVSQAGAGTSDELPSKGTMSFLTTGNWQGTCIIQREDNNCGDWTDFRTYEGLTSGARNDSLSWTESDDNIKYRIYAAAGMTAGFGATLNVQNPDKSGIVKVVSVVDAETAVVRVISELESTATTTRWYEGAWSNVRGWPAAIAFFGDRCIYAGAYAGSGASRELLDYPALQALL